MKNQFRLDALINKSEHKQKIQLYFATKTPDDDFDNYERNYTLTYMNPVTIYGIVTEISPTTLVWKSYGLSEFGSVQVLCDSKYEEWFRNCHKVVIEENTYNVFKEATGNVLIQKRPYNMIRVTLQRKG